MSISRRTALLATGAAAITAGVVTAPLAMQADDADLLARIGQFHDVYGEWQDVWEKHRTHRAAVEAMPD